MPNDNSEILVFLQFISVEVGLLISGIPNACPTYSWSDCVIWESCFTRDAFRINYLFKRHSFHCFYQNKSDVSTFPFKLLSILREHLEKAGRNHFVKCKADRIAEVIEEECLREPIGEEIKYFSSQLPPLYHFQPLQIIYFILSISHQCVTRDLMDFSLFSLMMWELHLLLLEVFFIIKSIKLPNRSVIRIPQDRSEDASKTFRS